MVPTPASVEDDPSCLRVCLGFRRSQDSLQRGPPNEDCLEMFPARNPLLFWHLLPLKLLAAGGTSKGDDGGSPEALLSSLLGLAVDQVSYDALVTSYGPDSLAGMWFTTILFVHI